MNLRCSGQTYYGTADVGGPVSLYIHYPFCVKKCRYCDFLSGPADEETRQRYLDALCEEIRAQSVRLKEFLPGGLSRLPEVDTIFFGGGTPSLMTPHQADHLMFVLASSFLIDEDAEITLECNPGTADCEKLRAFRELGMNRLSIGVQSFRDEELQLLGRIHTAEQAGRCVEDARRAGFTNVSLDLMSALPGQTHAQWMENLKAAVMLEPEHISAYSLILEDGTPLKAAYEAGRLAALPEEDSDRQMYHDTKTFLEQYGYHRYEISNYARPGYESRHNRGYWTGHPYLGLGLGASSYLTLAAASQEAAARREFAEANSLMRSSNWCGSTNSEIDDPPSGGSSYLTLAAASQEAGGPRKTMSCRRVRWRNTDRFEDYLRCPADGTPQDVEILSQQDQMAEFMILGLRCMQGVSEAEFAAEYGKTVDDVYGPVLARYGGLGLLTRRDGRIAFTVHGIDVSNTILADFLPDKGSGAV